MRLLSLRSLRDGVIGVVFRRFEEICCRFLGSVGVEVDGLEPLQDGGRSGELAVVTDGVLTVILGGQAGGYGNGADHEVEEDEENSGSEPAVHGSP